MLARAGENGQLRWEPEPVGGWEEGGLEPAIPSPQVRFEQKLLSAWKLFQWPLAF